MFQNNGDQISYQKWNINYRGRYYNWKDKFTISFFSGKNDFSENSIYKYSMNANS